MYNKVNFDELAQKAFAPTATNDDYENLFAAVFSLGEWYFIADAEFQYKMPYCAPFKMFEDVTAMMVFTDGERARKFILEGGLKGGAAVENIAPEKLIIKILTDGILDFFDRLAPFNIAKIFFNPDKDSHGFHHDLKMMRPIYDHLKNKGLLNSSETVSGRKPVEKDEFDFDMLSEKAMQTNAMEDLNALFGAAFALPKWHFISRGELPDVYPFVASNPAAADNQPMIRAFTDTDRLMRFARENNLTDTDGSCKVLTIPTDKIIPYIEGFVEQGAFGVWFNSDSASKDFYIPIKQLQPIKDHLEKLNFLEKPSVETVLIKLKDGLGFPNGVVHPANYSCNLYCRVPSDWLNGISLKTEKLELFYQTHYGETWRMGNSDDSFYVVIDVSTMVMPIDAVKETKFGELQNTREDNYWFYIINENGKPKSISAVEFQAEIDAVLRQISTAESRQKQENLTGLGVSETADGGFDQNLSINAVGGISLEASIRPFHAAIIPLLEDFQGTEDFVILMRYDPVGISELVKAIEQNAHGDYLQIRRFYYLNPKNNTRLGINNIHSRVLRHVKTNASLIVSLELCKIMDEPHGAVFYHRFEGPRETVLSLQAAIQPILENFGYQPVQN